MKNKWIVILLCLLMFALVSCAATVSSPSTNIPSIPAEPDPVTIYYQYKYVKAPYVRGTSRDWLSYARESLDTDPPTGRRELVPWSEELGVEPGGRIDRIEEHPSSHVYVSEEVYAFLESGSTVQHTFLIQNYNKNSCDNIVARDASYAEWCETDFVGGSVSEKTGHIIWTGGAATLLEIAQSLKSDPPLPYESQPIRILICFPSEFDEIYGMTMEQARILTDKGLLDGWSTPVEESPFYEESPAEIAAYLTEHPELLAE